MEIPDGGDPDDEFIARFIREVEDYANAGPEHVEIEASDVFHQTSSATLTIVHAEPAVGVATAGDATVMTTEVTPEAVTPIRRDEASRAARWAVAALGYTANAVASAVIGGITVYLLAPEVQPLLDLLHEALRHGKP